MRFLPPSNSSSSQCSTYSPKCQTLPTLSRAKKVSSDSSITPSLKSRCHPDSPALRSKGGGEYALGTRGFQVQLEHSVGAFDACGDGGGSSLDSDYQLWRRLAAASDKLLRCERIVGKRSALSMYK